MNYDNDDKIDDNDDDNDDDDDADDDDNNDGKGVFYFFNIFFKEFSIWSYTIVIRGGFKLLFHFFILWKKYACWYWNWSSIFHYILFS